MTTSGPNHCSQVLPTQLSMGSWKEFSVLLEVTSRTSHPRYKQDAKPESANPSRYVFSTRHKPWESRARDRLQPRPSGLSTHCRIARSSSARSPRASKPAPLCSSLPRAGNTPTTFLKYRSRATALCPGRAPQKATALRTDVLPPDDVTLE